MNVEQQLRNEFEADEGTFLFLVRTTYTWDEDAFLRLTSLMYDVADKLKGSTEIPTWIANGFWFCDTWVKDCTYHRDFQKPEAKYHARSCELLHELAYFLFVGESPYEGDTLKKLAKGT